MSKLLTKLKKSCTAIFVSTGIAIAAATPSSAATLFDNGGSSFDAGFLSSFDTNVSPLFFVGLADDFELVADSIIEGFTWTGFSLDGGTFDQFILSVIKSDGGVPGTAMNPTNVIFNEFLGDITESFIGTTGGVDTYQYSTSIAPLILPSGEYFLSVVNAVDRWAWSATNQSFSSPHFRSTDGGLSWGLPPAELQRDLGFSIKGKPVQRIPEPSFMLGSAVCLGLGLFFKRIIKKKQ